MTKEITNYPLHWPDGWKRSTTKKRSSFSRRSTNSLGSGPVTIAQATRFVIEELRRMGVADWSVIISSNLKLRLSDGLPLSSQRNPDDVGVSVWWKEGKHQRVIALDQYERIADNLYAVGKTIEAMRGIERWGGGEILERTFSGFTALPDLTKEHWSSVLGVSSTNAEDVVYAYRKLCSVHHSDRGGDPVMFQKVQTAYTQARNEIGF